MTIPVSADPTELVCANHPNTPTRLRCYKCNKPICAKCAVRTPVGYRCKDCNRAQQQIFDTAQWYDYLIALAVTVPLSAIAGFLVTSIGFFVIVLAPVVGGILAEVVRWAVRKRRSQALFWVATGGFAVGGLLIVLIRVLPIVMTLLMAERGVSGSVLLAFLSSFLWPLVYVVFGAGTFYARLRGISM